jgi:hypothetical protein
MADGLLFERLRQACHDLAAARSRRQNAEARITRPHQDGKAGGGYGKQSLPPRHRTRRSSSQHRKGLLRLTSLDCSRSAGRSKLSVPRAYRLRKTRIVEATTESLVKNPRAVIKMDCAAFQRSHEIAKLIGSAGITNRHHFPHRHSTT